MLVKYAVGTPKEPNGISKYEFELSNLLPTHEEVEQKHEGINRNAFS